MNHRFKVLSLIMVLTTLIGAAFPAAAKECMSLSRLGVERGLSNNHVVGITQDKQGYIWIATDEGLNRFDGHNFKTFYKDELSKAPGLTGNELNYIIDDPKRPILWVATQRAGLNAYNYETDTFTTYVHDPNDPASLVTNDVTCIAPAADGKIWVSTYWKGVDLLDPETGKFEHYNYETVKEMPNSAIMSVLDGGDGFLYLAHEHGGFTIVDIAKRTARNFLPEKDNPGSLPSADLSTVYRDSLGNIWLGGLNGLTLFNHDDNTFIDISKDIPELRYPVSDIRQFSDGKLWVAMERGGLASIDLGESLFGKDSGKGVTVIPSGTSEGMLSSPSVRSVFQDKYSNIWAGTWGGGINLLTPTLPAFRLHESSVLSSSGQVTADNSVFTVLYDRDHRLWVGCDRGGLQVFDGDRKLHDYTRADGLTGDVAQAAWQSPDGTLWFGFFNGGMSYLKPGSSRFESVFPKGSAVDVRNIVGDDSGRLLIGTSVGMWKYDPSSKALKGPFGVGNGLVRKVFPIEPNRILIGTFGSGLVITDSLFNEIDHLDVNRGLPSNTVNDIFRSRDGAIWVATGEGLLKFADFAKHPDKFELINRASGLGNSHVHAIAQDRAGNIWVSTNGGISCVEGEKILSYSHRDHIPLGNFLPHSVTTDQQGNIYFGGISGLCVFSPVKVLEQMPAPPAVITELQVLNPSNHSYVNPEVIQLTDKKSVKLKPYQNSFDIYFTTGNFAIAREVEYEYMLEGLDNNWVMARNGNVASYRALPAGSYVFKVRTRLRNQEWGEVSEVKIQVPYPMWLTWWAKVIYIALILVLIGFLLYFYKEHVKSEARYKAEKERHAKEQELNDERLRFYTNITHELRTPLTLILGPLEDVVKSNKLPSKEGKNLQMVHRNAERLLDLVNRLLDFRKTETSNRKLCVRHGNLAATVFEVALKYKELNRNDKVKVDVTTECGELDILYDKEVVTVILDNLISNAVKYTPEGHVDVSLKKEGNRAVIKVSDTGLGISKDAVSHIFDRYYQEGGPHQAAGTGIGLALVKNLVALHHATISVVSEPGKGTTFTVTLPLDDEYPEALHTEEGAKTLPQDEEAVPVVQPESDRKPLVLVVEDNADIRDYVKQSFTDLYDVRLAANGEEGLRMALEIMPSVVVSDIMMPVMDGVELTRRLKADVRTSHIPVILLTAKAGDEAREEGYASGADSYLIKPFSASLLQTRINNLLFQRAKLTEMYASQSAPVKAETGDSLEAKRKKLLKSLSDVDREFVEKLTKVIKDNVPAENVDVNFLSGALCMSSSTLYRKVKAVTGLSPNEYIRKTKMQMAEELLLGGHFTMSEIAYKVGLNSTAYFRICFKEEFGMNPSEYVKKLSETEK